MYRDIVDCIVHCACRFWEQKDTGLCRTQCADSCVMHTLNGPPCGVESVVQGTLSPLSPLWVLPAFADRRSWPKTRSGAKTCQGSPTPFTNHQPFDARRRRYAGDEDAQALLGGPATRARHRASMLQLMQPR